MADYKVQIGTELKTNEISTTLKNYKGNINVNATLDIGDVTKKLASYKTKSINVEAKLTTKGITDAIRAYKPPKKVYLESFLSTKGITEKIRAYKPPTPIRVDVELTKTSINQQIRDIHPTELITVGAKLDDDAIGTAIRTYKAPASIKVMVDPDFSEAASKISNYQMRNLLKVNVKLNKTSIESAIHNFQTSEKIIVGAKLRDNAIETAIRTYAGKELVPITVDFKVGDGKEVSDRIKLYQNTPVHMPVELMPAKEKFDSSITKTPIKVNAILNPENINTAIDGFIPKSQVKVGVQFDKDNIAQQIGQVNVGMPIKLGVELDPKGVSNVQTQIDNLRKQIEAIGNIKINLGGGMSGVTSGSGVGGIGQGVTQGFVEADIKIKDMANSVNGLKSALKQLGFNKSSIDAITREFDELNISVKNVTTRLDKNKNLSLTVKGLDKYERTVTLMKSIGKDGKPISLGSSVSQSFKETENAFVRLKQIIDQTKGFKVKLTGLDSEKDKQRIAEITSQLKGLHIEYQDLYNITKQNLSNSQLDALKQKSIEASRAMKIAKSAMADKAVYDKEQAEIKQTRDEYQKLIKIANSMKRIKVELTGLDSEKDKQRIAGLTAQLKSFESEYNRLLTANKAKFNTKQFDVLNQKARETKNAVRDVQNALTDSTANKALNIKGNFSGYEAQIQALVGDFNKLSMESKDVEDGINRVKQALVNMRNASDDKTLVRAEQEFQKELKETLSLLTLRQTMEEQDFYQEDFEIKKADAQAELNRLFEQGSQASRKFGNDAHKLQIELDNVGNTKGIEIVNGKIRNLQKEIKNSHFQTQKLSTRLKEQFSKYSNYLSVYTVFMYGTMALRSMFEQVKLIDSAMTELKKVTDETDATYSRFLKNAASDAKEIGTTIDGLISSTAEFAKIGYSFEDSQDLAKVANVYKVVGDNIESVEDATESLISTMAAFKDEMGSLDNADFAMSIVDKFNEVSNKYSIGSGGLGEALKRSASSMAAANNTLDETIALITAAM